RVGTLLDAVELKVDPFVRARLTQRITHRLGLRIVAELRAHIRLAIHALGRHLRVKAIGAPADLERHLGPLRQSLLQPAFADEAPRTNRVGNDVDLHGRSLARRGRARKPLRPPAGSCLQGEPISGEISCPRIWRARPPSSRAPPADWAAVSRACSPMRAPASSSPAAVSTAFKH